MQYITSYLSPLQHKKLSKESQLTVNILTPASGEENFLPIRD